MKKRARKNPDVKRAKYLFATIYPKYIEWRTDTGLTGKDPYSKLSEAESILYDLRRRFGLENSQVEIRNERIKKNPKIHIDIGSHNAVRSRTPQAGVKKVKTNPKLAGLTKGRRAHASYQAQRSTDGKRWIRLADFAHTPEGKNLAFEYIEAYHKAAPKLHFRVID